MYSQCVSLATFVMKEHHSVFKLIVNFNLILCQYHSYFRVCCDLVPCTLCCVLSVCILNNGYYERVIAYSIQFQPNSRSISF